MQNIWTDSKHGTGTTLHLLEHRYILTAVAVLGFTFLEGGDSGVAIIAAGGHGPILPQ